jgi:hypothetical protein
VTRSSLLQAAIGGLTLVVAAWVVRREHAELSSALGQVSGLRFAAAGLLALLGTVAIEQVWFALTRGLGIRANPRDAGASFFVTQLGKYMPGSVWPAAAQMQLGKRWGVPRRLLLASNLLLLAMVVASGTIVGATVLPFTSPGGLARYGWLLGLLVPLLICLHPRTMPWLIDKAFGLLGRDPVGASLSTGGLRLAALWAVVAWLLLGAHIATLASGFQGFSATSALASVGGMGLAWAAGVAFIPAPAGAGVREGVLVIVLAPFVGVPAALTVALASRVQLVLADVVLALASVVTIRRW